MYRSTPELGDHDEQRLPATWSPVTAVFQSPEPVTTPGWSGFWSGSDVSLGGDRFGEGSGARPVASSRSRRIHAPHGPSTAGR